MAWYRIAVCFGLGLLLTALAAPLRPALAQFDDIQEQTAAPDADAAAAAGAVTPLSADELRELVAPVALYPDELLSVVLPAATQPLQIVEAQRFLEKQKADPNLKPDEDWDPSVLALLNYPDVIKIMSDDLDWTQRLGNAIMDQQADVLAAIQTARSGATSAGYLQSNDKQTVVTENETIVIKSADPEVIYVPTYDPAPIVENTYVNYPPPVYSQPYPPYYAPAATFFTGMFVGAAFSYGMNWHDNDIDIDCCAGGGNTNNVNIGNGNTNINRDNIQNRFNGENRPQPKGTNAKGKGQGNMKWSPQKARAKSSAPRPTTRPSSSSIGKQLNGGTAGGGAKVNKGPSTRPAAQTRQDSQRGNKSLGANPQKRQQQMQQKTQQRQQARPQQQRQAPSQFKPKGGAFQQMPSQQKTRQQSNRGNRSMSGGGGNRGGGGGGGRGGSTPRRR